MRAIVSDLLKQSPAASRPRSSWQMVLDLQAVLLDMIVSCTLLSEQSLAGCGELAPAIPKPRERPLRNSGICLNPTRFRWLLRPWR